MISTMNLNYVKKNIYVGKRLQETGKHILYFLLSCSIFCSALHFEEASLVAQTVRKNTPAMWETWV